MMDKDDWIEADIDDPYRHCDDCDLTHHEEFGHRCNDCDEWICTPCWEDHTTQCPERPVTR